MHKINNFDKINETSTNNVFIVNGARFRYRVIHKLGRRTATTVIVMSFIRPKTTESLKRRIDRCSKE